MTSGLCLCVLTKTITKAAEIFTSNAHEHRMTREEVGKDFGDRSARSKGPLASNSLR